MIYKNSQSLMDYLMEIMPDLKSIIFLRPTVNKNAANNLLQAWKKDNNGGKDKKIKRPLDMSTEDITEMESAGLIKANGDYLDVTAKGIEVIKTMILGDNRSAFSKDKSPISYDVALANTSPKRKIKTALKVANRKIDTQNWYNRSQNG